MKLLTLWRNEFCQSMTDHDDFDSSFVTQKYTRTLKVCFGKPATNESNRLEQKEDQTHQCVQTKGQRSER